MVSSAEAAIEHAVASRPALVVMDIRLRGARDGIDAALEIYRRTGVRCLFATAHQDQAVRDRARPADPLGWLPKPYPPGALVRLIRDLLQPE